MFRLGLRLKMRFIAISMVSWSRKLVRNIVGNTKFFGKICLLNLRNKRKIKTIIVAEITAGFAAENGYTLNKKSNLHWRGIGTYLYLQLMKLSLISRNMSYPRKYLISLKQVYTFQSNQIKLENLKSSLPSKIFIVYFLTTLNPRKPNVR